MKPAVLTDTMPFPLSFVSPPLLDGYLVHQAALSAQLETWLFPGQVLLTHRPGSEPGELSFVHGVPHTSRLSSAIYTHDQRMRRALLERAGLPVPKGASFTLGRGVPGAKRFARDIGFPVVLKPMRGTSTIEVIPGIRNVGELTDVINYFRESAPNREGFVQTSYSLGQSRKPGALLESTQAPLSSRFLVERHVFGQYLRILVIDDDVVSIIHCTQGPWDSQRHSFKDVRSQTHDSIFQLAINAATAVPGLKLKAIDLVTDDHTNDLHDQDPRIVALSDRPWMYPQMMVSDQLGLAVGHRVLSDLAKELNIQLPPVATSLSARFRAESVPLPDNVAHRYATEAEARDLTGTIRVIDGVEGTIEGIVQGPAASVAMLQEALVSGQWGNDRAMFLETVPRPYESLNGFRIIP